MLIDGVPADTHSISDFVDGLAFGELLTDRSGRWAELIHGDPDIQSIYKRACELDRFDLIIVDESHLISPDGEGMYQQFLSN